MTDTETEEVQVEKRKGGKGKLFGLLAVIGAVVAVMMFWRRRGGDDDEDDDED